MASIFSNLTLTLCSFLFRREIIAAHAAELKQKKRIVLYQDASQLPAVREPGIRYIRHRHLIGKSGVHILEVIVVLQTFGFPLAIIVSSIADASVGTYVGQIFWLMNLAPASTLSGVRLEKEAYLDKSFQYIAAAAIYQFVMIYPCYFGMSVMNVLNNSNQNSSLSVQVYSRSRLRIFLPVFPTQSQKKSLPVEPSVPKYISSQLPFSRT